MFEKSADFPSNRSELYKEGIDILLKKWDGKRNISREQVYKKLSVQHKENLFSQIARITFERGDYFFRQQEIEQHIADYIRNLPGASKDFEALQLESSAVFKSIEAQHGLLVERARGIYSFSHLTFHEYFTAREIVAFSDPQALETALKRLSGSITDKRWREVFLLTCGMLRSADYLLQLMKRHIDELVAGDEQLQAFLSSVSQKSRAVPARYKPVTVRAFYLDLELARTIDLIGGTLAYDLDLAPELERELQQLKDQLPDPDKDTERLQAWWKASGGAWTEKLRAVMIKHRHIGHDWQFSKKQQDKLRQYYDTNKLLVGCLNSDCYVSRAVRDEIEETLLLPTAEAKQSKGQEKLVKAGLS